MAHRHNAVHRAKIPCGVQNGVKQRDQRGDAFERKTLRAQVARLKNLLEEVGANQAFKNLLLVDFELGTLDTLGDPSPPLGLRQVHEFHADVPAIDAASFLCSLASQFQIGDASTAGKRQADPA